MEKKKRLEALNQPDQQQNQVEEERRKGEIESGQNKRIRGCGNKRIRGLGNEWILG